MADLLKAAKDPKFREDVIRGLGETFSRGVAGVLGAPVDLTTMAMRPFGYNVPAEQVVGGSEYIGRQMEEAGLISSARRPAAEFLANVLTPDPMDVAKLGAMAVPVVGRVMNDVSAKGMTLVKQEAKTMSANDFLDANVSDVLPAHIKTGTKPKTIVHENMPLSSLTPSEYDEFDEILDSPKSYEKVKQMVGKELPPILVKGTSEDTRYLPQVIDGHHRTMAAIMEKKQAIPVSYDAETLAEIWKKQNNDPRSAREIVKEFEKNIESRFSKEAK